MINFRAQRFFFYGENSAGISEMQRSPTSRRYFQFLQSVFDERGKETERETKRKRKRARGAKRRKGEANDRTYRMHGVRTHETITLIFTGKIHKGTNGTYTTKQAALVFPLIFAAA
ncbi:hypothetical protein K0M31_011433 [Melipona bicolor]|uniref:Uncharacterized protein n=1 Tax=Melipona bicolor TaxID=60889 RepID=A0AA40G9I4_9HYME|nr:hypothetical protein K0M31_011433 [Melipona bicolor]